MAGTALKMILPVFCFGIALYGILLYFFDNELNSCEMTYMFETPEYIKVPMKRDIAEAFPRYNLFVYGEGKYAEGLRNGKLSGIPVLFVPGNAGSYRQVRSIASVAMRMGHALRASFHFNVFAIDFREEISALYGGVLNDQILFVQHCIKHTQSLYSVKKKKKLIIIAHSMGGVVAQAVFSIPDFDYSSISIIYTLATPHNGPVLPLDSPSVQIYSKLFETWKNQLDSELSEIPLISIGGGDRDYVVRSELTSLEFHKTFTYHAMSSAIPGVWASTDHLAIVWCKQLILTLSRSMFDLIDSRTKQVSANLTLVNEVLVHHFIERSYGDHFSKLPFLPSSVFSTSGQWLEQNDLSWRFLRFKILSSVYIMIPLFKDENILVIASGLVKGDWVYACSNKSPNNATKTCLTGHNISKQGKIIPSRKWDVERRVVNLASHTFIDEGYSHILIYIPPINSQVDLLGERYKIAERHKQFAMPSVFERISSFSPVRVVSFLLADRAVFYNVTLLGLSHVFEAATLILETRICRAGSIIGQGIIKLHIPWSNEDVFHHIQTTLGGTTFVPIKLHKLHPHGSNQNVQLHFMLDPECSYVLFASFPLSNIISQFMKFYGLFIPGYSIALLVSIISGQMYAIGAKGTCPSALYILGKFPTYLSLVLLPSILYYGVWITGFGHSFIPTPDHIVMEKSGFYSVVVVRSILYIVSYGMVASFNFTIMQMFSLCARFWMWLRRKSVLKVTEKPLQTVHEKNFKISHADVACCALLAAIAIGISGAVAIFICLYIYCLKLFNMLVKCQAEEERRGFSAATSKWHLQAVLTILWICAVLLTLPGLFTWGSNVSFSLKLVNDPHTLPCFVLILSSGFLWQLQFPFSHRVYYKTASHVIHVIALVISLYGIESIFRLLYFISATFAVITVQMTMICGIRQFKLD